MYTLQFHKTNRWRIFDVKRYVKTENEYFPEGDLKEGQFKCPTVNVSLKIPDGWEEMDNLELFKFGYLPYKNLRVNDTLVVKYKLLMAIKKSNENERLLTYITEAKYGDEAFKELSNTLRLAEIENYQSKVDKDLIKTINEYGYTAENQKINNMEFLVISQKKSFNNNTSTENISFDTIIDDYLLSIEGFTDDEASRNELFSVVGQYRF